MPGMDDPRHAALAALLNLGPVSARWVLDAGITSRRQLARLGPVRAYLKVRAQQPRASLNLLWALAGALEQRHFTDLPDGMRESLLLELDARTAVEPRDGRTPPRARTRSRRKRSLR
jgi:DNA transformation protein